MQQKADKLSHEDFLIKDLKQGSIEVSKQHTGDSSYPTEYTISIGNITGLVPVLDMALIDFTLKLLRESSERRDKALERIAAIIGEDE